MFSLTIIWAINYKYGVINIASTGNPKKNQTEAEESTILLSYGGKFTVTFLFYISLHGVLDLQNQWIRGTRNTKYFQTNPYGEAIGCQIIKWG